ncbi:hypothetical protein GOODEAATRI_024583, partial [Goodea atripinnis]
MDFHQLRFFFYPLTLARLRTLGPHSALSHELLDTSMLQHKSAKTFLYDISDFILQFLYIYIQHRFQEMPELLMFHFTVTLHIPKHVLHALFQCPTGMLSGLQ